MVTPETLQQAQQTVTDLQAQVVHARDARDQIIHQAVKEGMTMYKVAKATGLTQAAISKIQTRKQ